MPASDFVATVVAGGQRYTAWKSVYIRRDYGDWCSHFEFTAAEPGAYGGGWSAIRLKPGDPVQIYLGSVKVIDGSVTVREAAIDDKNHDLVIGGLSLTQDLHSSVSIKPGTYSGSTFEQAARAVMSPSGVKLVIRNPPALAAKPFKDLVAQYGETVGEFVERIAKMRGFFLTDDENGNLVAGQMQAGGTPAAELQEGRNILRGTCKLSNETAWSGLNAIGQQTGDDSNWPPRDYAATVTDPTAATNRTKTIISEHPGDSVDHQQRIAFEACYSAWGKVDCQITVVGWHKDDGSLWTPAEHVTVLSKSLFPSESGAVGDLGIQACVYTQDSQNGTLTTLIIRKSNALMTNPSPFAGQGVSSGSSTDPVSGTGAGPAEVSAPDTV